MSKKKPTRLLPYFIWLLAVAFFFYEFFLRVLPATMAHRIIGDLNLDIEQFAFISSAYYITYSCMQVPVGFLVDRFSLRFLITIACGICSIGVLWFGMSHGIASAFFARLAIGLGSSFGFIGLMFITLNWFERKHFAFLIGCGQLLGALGPLCAGGPIALMLEANGGDWRTIFIYCGWVGVALSLLIGLFFQGKPKNKKPIVFLQGKIPFRKQLKALSKEPQAVWILLYAGMIYVTMPLLGAYWGTTYLQTRGLEKPIAALLISMIWVGLAVGSPLLGKASDLVKRRVPFLTSCAILGIISSFFILFTPSTNAVYLGFLFFLIGVAASGQNLTFALITENTPKEIHGTALAINNTAIALAAALLPPVVTFVIQHAAQTGPLNERVFEVGFLIIPIVFSVSLLTALFGIKETFCRQQNQIHRVH